MISRLTTRSLRSSATWIFGTHQTQETSPDVSHSFVPRQSTSESTKCVTESPPIGDIHVDSSSIDSDDTHDDASGDESDEDTVPPSDGFDPRTREYILKEAKKRLAAEGAAPVSNTALTSLERHLLTRSRGSKCMSSLSVSLFNFHSQTFAQTLLNRSVGNLVLVESALEHSMKAKDFCRSARRKGHRVDAFHADATALFGLDKKKKEDKGVYRKKKKDPLFSFPDQLVARPRGNEEEEGTLMSLRLWRRESSRPMSLISPILICPLGNQTQHTAMLDAFLRSLLQHHLKIDEKGLFALGDMELITYLHSEQAAHLLSSSVSSLSFVSHAARRRSQLMHTLFHIGVVDSAGLSSSSFSPHNIPPSKKMAHAKKMKEAGFRSSRWFGCWLRPRLTVSIGGREIVSGVQEEEHDSLSSDIVPPLPPSVLLPYAVWCETLGKLPGTKKAEDVLSTLIPGSSSAVRSIIPPGAKIGEVSVEDTDALFVEALPELKDSPSVAKYHEKNLMKGEDKTNFVD